MSDHRVRRKGVVEFIVLAQKFSVVTQKECCHDRWVVPLKEQPDGSSKPPPPRLII